MKKYMLWTKERNLREKQFSAGFTLIELIIVLGIVLVLTALIFPSYQGMIARGRQAACLGNLRSYGSATLTFSADQGGVPGTNSQDATFHSWLVPQYLPKDLRCPLANTGLVSSKQSGYYTANSALCQYFPKLVGIPVPASHVVLATEMYNTQFFASYSSLNYTMWGSQASPPTPASEGSYRQPIYHGSSTVRGLNLFFLDGSAAFVHPTNNDWTQAPTLGNATNGGYFYHQTQFENMKAGKAP